MDDDMKDDKPKLVKEIHFPPGAYFEWSDGTIAILDNLAILSGVF